MKKKKMAVAVVVVAVMLMALLLVMLVVLLLLLLLFEVVVVVVVGTIAFLGGEGCSQKWNPNRYPVATTNGCAGRKSEVATRKVAMSPTGEEKGTGISDRDVCGDAGKGEGGWAWAMECRPRQVC